MNSRGGTAGLIAAGTWYAFTGVGLAVFYYFFIMQGFSYSVSLLAGTYVSLMVFLIAAQKTDERSAARRHGARDATALTLIVLLGVALRAGWVYFVPPIFKSDFLDNWNAAGQLLETGNYFTIKDGYVFRSFRPPGYPFALAVFMYVFGKQPWLPLLMNICFYVLTCILVYSLAANIAGSRAALFSVLLLAVWPSDVAMADLAATEPISLLLCTASVRAFITACRERSWKYGVAAGILTGYGAFVRPSTLLVAAVWLFYSMMSRQGRIEKIQSLAIPAAAMILTIIPWTVRNYVVLGYPVAVSTNGGDVFYRANNPLANGTWSPGAEIDLDNYKHNEVLWDRMSYQLGKKWIAENPLKFVKLGLKKQAILLGEDSHGAFVTLSRWAQKNDESVYNLFRQTANMWWLGIWVLAVVGAVRSRHFLSSSPEGALLLLMILYFVAIHSVFESQSRYHMSFLGFLAIIASLAVYPGAGNTTQMAAAPSAYRPAFSEKSRRPRSRNQLPSNSAR